MFVTPFSPFNNYTYTVKRVFIYIYLLSYLNNTKPWRKINFPSKYEEILSLQYKIVYHVKGSSYRAIFCPSPYTCMDLLIKSNCLRGHPYLILRHQRDRVGSEKRQFLLKFSTTYADEGWVGQKKFKNVLT